MISIVYDVKRYREQLDDTVREGDTVIEIGPHMGQAIKKYVGRTEKTIAIDIGEQSEKALEKIRARHANLVVLRADTRKFDTIIEVLKHASRCDVLAIDLGGGRYPDTVFKVWAVWSGTFKPRDSILRNRGLAEFIQRARIDEHLEHDFPDDGWMSTWGRSTPALLKQRMDELGHWLP